MSDIFPIEFDKVVLDCKDPKALSGFYVDMLKWQKIYEEDEVVIISSPNGIKLEFQRNINYVPPVWPEEPNKQQQMVHIDFKALNIEHKNKMVEHAINCGAKKAEIQYSENWTVMLDPEGHPFCFDIL